MATIALVDDDKNILASVTLLLEQEGYHVRAYSDAAAALGALSATPPDLAILDIKMPRMDGLELLRRLRQSADLPVIFLTSKDEEIDELMGLNAGADDYIRKPFSQRLLLERVKAVLRRGDSQKRHARRGRKKKRWCAVRWRSIRSATNAPGTASPSGSPSPNFSFCNASPSVPASSKAATI